MSTQQFDDSQHPREQTGKFATKPVSDAAGGMDALGAARPFAHMSPRDVDGEIAELWTGIIKADQRRERAIGAVRRGLGQFRDSTLGHRWTRMDHEGWPTSVEDAVTELRAQMDAGEVPLRLRDSARQGLPAYDDSTAELNAGMAAVGEREAERGHRPWSRFFVVTSSSGGHIHSSQGCSTCRPTTQFGWMPELSGQDEAQAVAANGAILCTVCYPSAPTEWTDGRDRRDKDGNPIVDSTCPGSGGKPAGETKQWGRTTYGDCPVCGENVTYGYSGLRKHKTPKTS